MKISKEEYSNNLLFYTILKNLIKCKLSESKMIQLEQLIKENKGLEPKKLVEFLGSQIVNEKIKTYDDYLTLISLCDDKNCSMWCDLMILAIELLLAKNLILE